MKKILILIIFISLIVMGLWAGPALLNYDGYFLIVLENATFQFSIFGLIAFVVVAILIGWALFILLRMLFRLLAGSHDFLFSFSDRRKRKAFRQGLISLAEGNYLEAKKRLDKVIEEDFDGLNLLALAEAEAQLGHKEKARAIWEEAAENQQTQVAANLCLIRDDLINEKCKRALTYIKSLPDKSQSDPSVIKLWIRALDQAGKYGEMKERLPQWKKALAEEYDAWVLKAAKGEFAEIASKEGANKLKEAWDALPRSTRKEPGQIAAYAQQLIDQAMFEEAQEVLVKSQKGGPEKVLYSLYRQLKNLQTNGAAKQLEGWLKRDDDNAELLSTLGQLAFNSGDLMLAEKALSKAIKLESNREDVLLLARIKEAQKDNIHALELYKQTIL